MEGIIDPSSDETRAVVAYFWWRGGTRLRRVVLWVFLFVTNKSSLPRRSSGDSGTPLLFSAGLTSARPDNRRSRWWYDVVTLRPDVLMIQSVSSQSSASSTISASSSSASASAPPPPPPPPAAG